MRGYNSTGRHSPSYDNLYEHDENGDAVRRPPIDPKVKEILDHVRTRETMMAMIELTANRATE